MSFNSHQTGIIHFISCKPFHWATFSFFLSSIAVHAQKAKGDTVSTTIQTVEIVGRKSKAYTSDYSFAATKIAMKNKDLPLTLNTVTKELISDRQAFRLGDVLKNVAGVSNASFYNQYSIRGISQNEEGQIINGMRTRQYYFLQPMTPHIERVEVFKGPASITMSSVDPGGTINMVTKKPLTSPRYEMSLSGGSFDTYRLSADLTGPLNKSRTLLYRFNGAHQNARSFRDNVKNNGLLIAPSISFVPNDKTSVNVEMIYSEMNGNLDRGQPIFGAVAGKTNLNSTPISLNLGAPGDYFKTKDLTLMGSLSHHFNKSISFNASYMKQRWDEDTHETRTTNSFVPDINNKPISSLAMMQYLERIQHWSVDNINAYFNFTYKTGAFEHQTLMGYDSHIWEKKSGGKQDAARGFLLKDGTVASSYNAANAALYETIIYNGIILPKPNVTPFDLTPGAVNHQGKDYAVLNIINPLPTALTTTHAAYIQHLVTWKKLKLLAGLRQEWFQDITNYKKQEESSFRNQKMLYRVGLTYSITENTNIYGTYLTGYQPQSNTISLMPQTANFTGAVSASLYKPLLSDLKEFGVKTKLFKKIDANFSVYEINQKNILVNANNPAEPDQLIQRGADISRGFEAEFTGYLLPQWHIYAGYSYIDAKVKDDSNPALIGLAKENTSKNSVNLWTRYNFNIQALKDFGIGAGMLYQSKKIPWFTRSFELPAYTTLDVALYYSVPQTRLQLALNVNNITNTTYWVGAQNYLRLFPGAPRNYLFTATFKI
ncbi:TonB-dependent siderophore receptor [Chryseobacterium mucoviscidosis]|uniref:TonB-dependent siderophore receptor n=1 Tax=Chryseobacterium mucoviscidosis TaxID=1945581 RepID=A0A202CD39_9FLAO|nr:TonB-dependent siderophore receptor [Chryseobacterium mucoviscidosis]OVE61723.1 TonB-dependent siderophore receptor [Chryseobacterium mucoviscidosis]